MSFPLPTLYTTSFKGIGQITVRELRSLFGDALHKIRTHKVRDYDIVQFDWTEDPQNLKLLGTTEDVFYYLSTVPLTGDKTDLQNFQDALTPNLIDPALLVHRQFHGLPHGRTSFRVIVQADHQPWQNYRRTKMQEAVELGICSRYNKWRVLPDNANLEFWVQQIDNQALIGLRLTDRTMRHRTYKTANLPASLRPTIARAMVHLSQPAPDDIFLDPMCGAGTLLIERALAGRYALLQGGDIDKTAIQTTLDNFGKHHKPYEIQQWDARSLPLPKQSVHKVVTNPPWGRQLSAPSELRPLYTSLCKEIDRVLKPSGIAVLLTSEWKTLKPAISRTQLTLVEQIKNIIVMGRHADIFVFQKFT